MDGISRLQRSLGLLIQWAYHNHLFCVVDVCWSAEPLSLLRISHPHTSATRYPPALAPCSRLSTRPEIDSFILAALIERMPSDVYDVLLGPTVYSPSVSAKLSRTEKGPLSGLVNIQSCKQL
jgi:hypothetical protein